MATNETETIKRHERRLRELEKFNAKSICKKLRDNCNLFGFKGSDGGFEAWIDGDEVCIAVDKVEYNIFKKNKEKIRKLLPCKELEYLDDGDIVVFVL